VHVVVFNNCEILYLLAPTRTAVIAEYSMDAGSFTDVVLHSSKNYHQERAEIYPGYPGGHRRLWRCYFVPTEFPISICSNLCNWYVRTTKGLVCGVGERHFFTQIV
jgi:hypothetical protein